MRTRRIATAGYPSIDLERGVGEESLAVATLIDDILSSRSECRAASHLDRMATSGNIHRAHLGIRALVRDPSGLVPFRELRRVF